MDSIEDFIHLNLGRDDDEWCIDYLLEVEDDALPRIYRRLPAMSRKDVRRALRVGIQELVRAHRRMRE